MCSSRSLGFALELADERTELRKTLALTIELQPKWLFHPRYRSPFNIAYVAAEHALLLLPDAMILALFKRVTYSKLAPAG